MNKVWVVLYAGDILGVFQREEDAVLSVEEAFGSRWYQVYPPDVTEEERWYIIGVDDSDGICVRPMLILTEKTNFVG